MCTLYGEVYIQHGRKFVVRIPGNVQVARIIELMPRIAVGPTKNPFTDTSLSR